ncbi:hypothetical protein TNCV_5076821 [Trichonephila clavipes]|uniref:Uncharacterized protein n=1 Tax=Trichonephila clavipes TaxID=2585209 RepID=A0A8X6RYE9_TRICX|nr:hypothetical protein TNCV_5076821 [Trichonephila clavipes]
MERRKKRRENSRTLSIVCAVVKNSFRDINVLYRFAYHATISSETDRWNGLTVSMIEKSRLPPNFFLQTKKRHRQSKIESNCDFSGTGRGSVVRRVDVRSRTRPFVFAICVRVVDKVGKESPLFNCCHECFIGAVADRIAAVQSLSL